MCAVKTPIPETTCDAIPPEYHHRNGNGDLPDAVATVPARAGKRPPGAPRGNRNRIAHGACSFAIGKMPAGASYVGRLVQWLRRTLRQAVVERHGATDVHSEAVIASACIHEGRRLLLARWLRLEGDALPLLDRAGLLDRIGNASTARDRCIERLGLDRSPVNAAAADDGYGQIPGPPEDDQP